MVDHLVTVPSTAATPLCCQANTRLSTNLIEAARGAGLLVHDVVLAPPDIVESAPY